MLGAKRKVLLASAAVSGSDRVFERWALRSQERRAVALPFLVHTTLGNGPGHSAGHVRPQRYAS